MNRYYQSNAVYGEIGRREASPFVWASGNSWILLYADASEQLRVILSVRGRSTLVQDSPDKARADLAESKATQLADAATLPFNKIVFDDNSPAIEEVNLYDHPSAKPRQVSLIQLKAYFSKMGLEVTQRETPKAINDASSSAYHNWQRTNLGAIKVTDIDLLRVEPHRDMPHEIIELKRSYYALENWSPYPQDFTNFNLIAGLASVARVRFTIAYNVRQKSPWLDDASRLSLFSYSKTVGASGIGIVTFDDFYNGNY